MTTKEVEGDVIEEQGEDVIEEENEDVTSIEYNTYPITFILANPLRRPVFLKRPKLRQGVD